MVLLFQPGRSTMRITPALYLLKWPRFITSKRASRSQRQPSKHESPSTGTGKCNWMLWLVEPDITPARKPDFSDRAPSGLLHLRTRHALRRERQHLGFQ